MFCRARIAVPLALISALTGVSFAGSPPLRSPVISSAAASPAEPSLADAAQRSVRATTAWVELPDAKRTDTTAFVLVENGTMYDVYVVGVQTEGAAKTELRQAQPAGPSTPVGEVQVPAFGQLEMSAKGVHLVLTDIKAPLKAGDVLPLIVILDSGDRLSVSAIVK